MSDKDMSVGHHSCNRQYLKNGMEYTQFVSTNLHQSQNWLKNLPCCKTLFSSKYYWIINVQQH